jgi:HSF-type DNA-binding
MNSHGIQPNDETSSKVEECERIEQMMMRQQTNQQRKMMTNNTMRPFGPNSSFGSSSLPPPNSSNNSFSNSRRPRRMQSLPPNLSAMMDSSMAMLPPMDTFPFGPDMGDDGFDMSPETMMMMEAMMDCPSQYMFPRRFPQGSMGGGGRMNHRGGANNIPSMSNQMMRFRSYPNALGESRNMMMRRKNNAGRQYIDGIPNQIESAGLIEDMDSVSSTSSLQEDGTLSSLPTGTDKVHQTKRKERAPSTTSFPTKLYKILCDPKYQEYIGWLPHGRAWRVLKPKAFEEEVIPKFFRSDRYASFMRQVCSSKTLVGSCFTFAFTY